MNSASDNIRGNDVIRKLELNLFFWQYFPYLNQLSTVENNNSTKELHFDEIQIIENIAS